MQWFKKYLFLSLSLLCMCAYATEPSLDNNDTAESSVVLFKGDEKSADLKREERITKTLQTQTPSLLQGESAFTGPKNSDVTLLTFFDYQCSHCKMMASVLDKLQGKNPSIKLVYKDFPILGAHSSEAAKAALAAQKQGKYNLFNHRLMQADTLSTETILKIAQDAKLNMQKFKQDLESDSINQQLERNIALAQEFTVESTPSLLIVSNKSGSKPQAFFVTGNASLEGLQNLINRMQD